MMPPPDDTQNMDLREKAGCLKYMFDVLVKEKRKLERLKNSRGLDGAESKHLEELNIKLANFTERCKKFIRPRKNSIGTFSVEDYINWYSKVPNVCEIEKQKGMKEGEVVPPEHLNASGRPPLSHEGVYSPKRGDYRMPLHEEPTYRHKVQRKMPSPGVNPSYRSGHYYDIPPPPRNSNRLEGGGYYPAGGYNYGHPGFQRFHNQSSANMMYHHNAESFRPPMYNMMQQPQRNLEEDSFRHFREYNQSGTPYYRMPPPPLYGPSYQYDCSGYSQAPPPSYVNSPSPFPSSYNPATAAAFRDPYTSKFADFPSQKRSDQSKGTSPSFGERIPYSPMYSYHDPLYNTLYSFNGMSRPVERPSYQQTSSSDYARNKSFADIDASNFVLTWSNEPSILKPSQSFSPSFGQYPEFSFSYDPQKETTEIDDILDPIAEQQPSQKKGKENSKIYVKYICTHMDSVLAWTAIIACELAQERPDRRLCLQDFQTAFMTTLYERRSTGIQDNSKPSIHSKILGVIEADKNSRYFEGDENI